MTPEQLQRLIDDGENAYVEFKSKIDLSNKEGKAGFLQEVLALANTLHSPAYLIIGVEDKTKKLVGVSDLTEEQLQQTVAAYCKPPIPFSYKVIDLEGMPIGVMQIFRSNARPHTLKSRLDYTDAKGKPHELRESQVFIRHGSIVEEATREDLIAILEDRSSSEVLLAQIASHLERMGSELPDVTYQLGEISNQAYESRPDDFPDRVIEGTFVSSVAGGLAALLWGPGLAVTPVLTMLFCFMIGSAAAALKIVRYDFWRAFFNGLILGVLLTIGFALMKTSAIVSDLVGSGQVGPLIAIGSIIGAVSGAIGSFLLLQIERRAR